MDNLLKRLLDASGISGYESEVAAIMEAELKKVCDEVIVDSFGNVIARKGKGGKKIMLAAHMDEIGLLVKHITKEGFLCFIKVGGIDDRILPGQRVVVKSAKGDFKGIIGTKPPHLQKDEESKKIIKHEDMFIDIGARSKEEAFNMVNIADQVVFEANSGELANNLCYGKAVDDRAGCYVLIKIMQRLNVPAEIYAVATVQEEVGLKGARTSSFRIAPDFAIALDITTAGDTPQISEKESALKLGEGVSITTIEAGGRGLIVNRKVKDMLVSTAKENNIKFQLDVLEGGMTDGAIIYMNREGVLTAVLSVPCRYIHAPSGVFSVSDIDSAVDLAVKAVEKVAAGKLTA